jgi:hypothetical protein
MAILVAGNNSATIAEVEHAFAMRRASLMTFWRLG